MLRQLLYSSRAKAESFAADLPEILRCSRRNNPELGITGVLILAGDDPDIVFIQAIEGEAEHVDLLVDTIKGDPRHTDVRILLDHEVEARCFASWSMGDIVVPPATADAARVEAEVRKALANSQGPTACSLITRLAPIAA
ncbi:BLUF domain-containing protein [Palleronia sp. LCG004]|uniref:BLUF domain-containing protein n=1 Tax=Palleronia sp. LCG004 TaxID=3079304 RepID=UPI0029421E02|nr:BLUF domain-containing protein [Palleronia sp. LCG004]WOI57081.1 BLUF domain-containing protein [Palleronia sp. LCG004]